MRATARQRVQSINIYYLKINTTPRYRLLALEVGSGAAWGTEGRGFESRRSDQIWLILIYLTPDGHSTTRAVCSRMIRSNQIA
jgi:hypothetical protein